jgi:hypothetical protein
VRRNLAEREYHASETGEGLQAPNRAHGLRTHFGPAGIRVAQREASDASDLLTLRLAHIGRGAELSPVPPGELWSDGPRVEIRRSGLVEWYLNSPLGLEQGFTLEQRPPGDGPLVLELAVEGSRASPKADRVVLESGGGPRLEYGDLTVVGGDGQTVPASLSVVNPHRIRIVVSDAGAVYPLTVDPLLRAVSDARIEGSEYGEDMGFSVSGAGDVNGDGYDDVIVSALRYDTGVANGGVALVFHGSASGIASGGADAADTRIEGDGYKGELGSSVAGAGDVNGDGYDDIIVGAWHYDVLGAWDGIALIYHGGPSGIANGGPADADTRLVGDQLDGEFGMRVAGVGDVNADGFDDVMVASYAYEYGESMEGAAFLYHGGPAGIPSGGPGTADSRLESDRAGGLLVGVAGAGDVNGDGYADVILGAYGYDVGDPKFADGAVFVYHGGPAGIASGGPDLADAMIWGLPQGIQLGFRVAGAGDVNADGFDDVIVSGGFYDAGEQDEGAAFVFHGGPAGIASGGLEVADAVLESNQEFAWMGFGVAGAGDVNGDGYDDVIVGAMRWEDEGDDRDTGAAFIYLGWAAGIGHGGPDRAHEKLKPDIATRIFGSDVAGAGDVNGDGYDDVVVGASGSNFPDNPGGAAFVYHGKAFELPILPVDIDVEPKRRRNLINLFAARCTEVAILGGADFDVGGVDVETLAFGPGRAAPLIDEPGSRRARRTHRDVNRDGYMDLVHCYRVEDAGISIGQREVCLAGRTLDGTPFEGCDAIITVPGCGIGFELAFVLPPLLWLYGQRRRRRA